MINYNGWKSIGTVLGETEIDHFYFSLKNYKAVNKIAFFSYVLKP